MKYSPAGTSDTAKAPVASASTVRSRRGLGPNVGHDARSVVNSRTVACGSGYALRGANRAGQPDRLIRECDDETAGVRVQLERRITDVAPVEHRALQRPAGRRRPVADSYEILPGRHVTRRELRVGGDVGRSHPVGRHGFSGIEQKDVGADGGSCPGALELDLSAHVQARTKHDAEITDVLVAD